MAAPHGLPPPNDGAHTPADLGALHMRYFKVLCRYAGRHLGPEHDPADVVQTVAKCIVAGTAAEREAFVNRHDLRQQNVYALKGRGVAKEDLRNVGVRMTPVRAIIGPDGVMLQALATTSPSLDHVPAICARYRR
jgi:hypothetical protein